MYTDVSVVFLEWACEQCKVLGDCEASVALDLQYALDNRSSELGLHYPVVTR